MQRHVQLELIERAFRNLERNSRDMVDAVDGTDVRPYFDPARLEAERRTLFRKYPLVLGHASQIPKPGDFFTHDDTGLPLIVARQKDGSVAAYVNVCRHRAARLTDARAGASARAFVCPYHAWSYGIDGRLIGVPGGDGFPGVNADTCSLTRVPAEERCGLIWVRPEPGATMDVDGFLAGLAPEFAAYDDYRNTLWPPEEWTRSMNWKLLTDTFLESYHFQYLHRGSIFPLFHPNAILFDTFGPHMRILTVKKSIEELRATDRADWTIRPHAICLYLVFPNTVLVWMDDHLTIFQMFPRGPDEGVAWVSFHNDRAPANDGEAHYWDLNRQMIRAALAEDFSVGEGVQRNFHTGTIERMVFGRFEQGLGTYHRNLDRAVLGELRAAE